MSLKICCMLLKCIFAFYSITKHIIMEQEIQGQASKGGATEKHFLGHPQGLFYLFFAELWERFSFYGMRALLTLYMVQQVFEKMAQRDTIAVTIYASYGALVYASPVLGGRISDKLLGCRQSIILGGILMAIGHFVMAVQHDVAFFLALGFLVMGNGFFKPNVSTFVGTLYPEGDKRKDSGYTIFYMGINIGAMLAPLACGWLGHTYGWHYGFGLAGVGMLVGLLFFWKGIRAGVFADKGLPPAPEQLQQRKWGLPIQIWVPVLAFLAVPLVAWMISSYRYIADGRSFLGETTVVSLFFYALGAFILFYMVYIMFQVTAKERQQLFAALFLIVCMTFFWAFFELQGSTLTLFAQRNVNLALINASQTNFINPVFIIALAVPMSLLWGWLSRHRNNPRSPYKFAFGLLWMALGFYVLAFSQGWADGEGRVPFFFLVFAYFLISTGELFMSPVGLSKMTDLAPQRMVAFIMGVWFLSSAYAFLIVGVVGKMLAIEGSAGDEDAYGLNSLAIYTEGFWQIGHVVLVIGLLALLLSPLVRRWMHEVH